jgi:hypothetical protein
MLEELLYFVSRWRNKAREVGPVLQFLIPLCEISQLTEKMLSHRCIFFNKRFYVNTTYRSVERVVGMKKQKNQRRQKIIKFP